MIIELILSVFILFSQQEMIHHNIGDGNPNWRAINLPNNGIVFMENVDFKIGKMSSGNFIFDIDLPSFKLNKNKIAKKDTFLAASKLYPAGKNKGFIHENDKILIFLLTDNVLTKIDFNPEIYGLKNNHCFLGMLDDKIYFYERGNNDIMYIKNKDGEIKSIKFNRVKKFYGIICKENTIYIQAFTVPRRWRLAPNAYDFETLPIHE